MIFLDKNTRRYTKLWPFHKAHISPGNRLLYPTLSRSPDTAVSFLDSVAVPGLLARHSLSHLILLTLRENHISITESPNSKECSQAFWVVFLKIPFIGLKITEKYWWGWKKCTEPLSSLQRNTFLQVFNLSDLYVLELDDGQWGLTSFTVSLHSLPRWSHLAHCLRSVDPWHQLIYSHLWNLHWKSRHK